MTKDLSSFEKRIGVVFNDKDLLQQVFVHRSYLNEHKSFPLEHNERLEFLGDAVLELIVTEYLYKKFPNPEGDLTNWRSALVRGEMIAQIAVRLGMNDYLFLSHGESQSTGKSRNLILANAFEALIGAMYLGHGYETTQRFIQEQLVPELELIQRDELHIDAKSRFQELIQDRLSVTPTYTVLSEDGPDHDKQFTVGVYVGSELRGSGDGSSKQRAEQAAAQSALERERASTIE
ncbi:MAG: ribonuclease III [Patescibacteria group bacterium]